MSSKKQASDEDLGLDAEQHPTTGMWRYLWTSPGAAECLGLFKHTTEGAARAEGRTFAEKQLAENARNARANRRRG